MGEWGEWGGEWLFGLDLPESDNRGYGAGRAFGKRNMQTLRTLYLSSSPLLKAASCPALFLSRQGSRDS